MPTLAIRLAAALLVTFASLLATHARAQAANVSGQSEYATWNCTGAACPWGAQLGGQALVWPAGAGNGRLGYTVDRGIYLPAAQANGMTISLEWGVAGVYAGLPDASSHRELATLWGGSSYRIEGLAEGEVLSVQGGGQFGYVLIPVDPTLLASQEITWTCTSSPCPWGPALTGQAVAWPASATPSQQRLGYTTSPAAYLPATYANGMKIEIASGSAWVYAGVPGAESHRLLATLSSSSGEYLIGGVGAEEVVSVQGAHAFTFRVKAADPAAPGDPGDPVEPGQPEPSATVVWSCTGSPCPWGPVLSGPALTWPDVLEPVRSRLGYSTSTGIYLPAAKTTGVAVTVLSGSASVYAVNANDTSYRVLGTLFGGQSMELAGLVAGGELISVQSADVFTYQVSVGEPPAEPPEGVMHSIPAVWRCDSPDCWGADWTGQVINWPSWAAYENNARAGTQSRTVYSTGGQVLYPYMGSWANGCHVTAVSGSVLIIEWERGTDLWRETWITPGQTHVISLISPEDGAMIETNYAWQPFSVQLSNCTPQVIR